MTRDLPGVWVDAENSLHIDLEAFMKGQGLPLTEANRRAAMRAIRDVYPEVPLEVRLKP